MSQLLKRTKKSCLKILRKISTSKQLFHKKSEDIEDTTNNNNNNNNYENTFNSNHLDYAMEIETNPMPGNEMNNQNFNKSTESLPSTTYHPDHDNQHKTRSPSPKRIIEIKDYNLDDESPNNTILHKLTARLFLTADGYDFQRLQQLRSDTGSEIIPIDADAVEYLQQSNFLFEKVRYKDDIRYFRRTPSTSSLENYRPNSMATTPDYEEQEFDFESDWQAVNNASNSKLSRAGATSNHQFTNFGFQANKEPFVPTINMSLGSRWNGNLQNVTISQERNNNNKLTPVVKWDINGNSLDDDDLLPHEYLEDFDKRLSRRLAAVQHLKTPESNESADSSLRSSSTTLETWVDEDLVVENSFNELRERTVAL